MIIAFTIFSLPVVCILGVVLRMRGTRLAYVWFLLFSTTGLVLLALLLLNPITMNAFEIAGYFPSGSSSVDISYRLTEDNKLIGIGVFVLALAFLATETISLKGDQSLYRWIELLIFASIAWVIVLAANAWTVLISWFVLDLMDFASQLITRRYSKGKFIPYFLFKLLGFMALVVVSSRAYQANPQYLLGGQIPNMGLWVLFAVFLHGGVSFQWLNNGNNKQVETHYHLIQLVIFISHYYLLSQVSATSISPILKLFTQLFIAAGVVLIAIRWLFNKTDEFIIDALILIMAFITGSIFIGENQHGIIFMLSSLLPLSWIFLAHKRTRQFIPLWLIGLFALSGFPFSLIFAALENMILQDRYFEIIMHIIPVAIIAIGVFRILRKPIGNFDQLEPLYQMIYIIGLILPLLGMIFILWRNLPRFQLSYLWVGISMLLASSLFYWIKERNKLPKRDPSQSQELRSNFAVFSREFSSAIRVGIEAAGKGLSYGARLLEAEGGILWAIVFLSLLFTILASFEGF